MTLKNAKQIHFYYMYTWKYYNVLLCFIIIIIKLFSLVQISFLISFNSHSFQKRFVIGYLFNEYIYK